MAVMVCKPGNGVWIVQGEHSRRIDRSFSWPCAPCSGPECAAFCCGESRECLCLQKSTWKPAGVMPCAPGICDMCFSPCGGYLYQLSGDADSLHARSTENGELLYAVPSGVFPRCLRQENGGRRLLCAGGALNRAFLFNAPELTINHEIQTAHPCFAADFWPGGLVLVCAGEGDDIRTIVFVLDDLSRKPGKILELPGMPCSMCVCGSEPCALVSTWNGLYKIQLITGSILWSRPEWALCFRMQCRGRYVLASDLPDGGVWLFCHDQPGLRTQLDSAPDSQACFV